MPQNKLTTADFIEKANKVHNNKYEYSLVNYIKSTEKVIIICKTHGQFLQTPNNHVNMKNGCPKCANRLTTNDFIIKAQKVHGNKYDYSLVEYTNNKTKVTIICPTHGPFMQRPDQHIDRRANCPKCAPTYDLLKVTKEEFIEKAQMVHNNKYDYSLVEYINNKTKVIIICKTHGQFMQTPDQHINRCSNCPKCSNKYQKLTLDEFIQKSHIVHNNKYDYSKVKYIDIRTKVIIICPKHGEFTQRPNNHANLKNGCPKCTTKFTSKYTKKLFIKRAHMVHNFKYDYSLVKYIDIKTKIKIICRVHGPYMQRPDQHLSGHSCIKCR